MKHAVIHDDKLNLHIESLEPDGMSVFVMANGRVRGALFHGTRFINTMRIQHNLGILETMILGQASLCGALLIPTMKGRENLLFRYDTNGPAAGFSIEANSIGTVRGFLLQNPIPMSKPLDGWDLSPFFGPGTLTISRQQEGSKTPQVGTVEIVNRNIAKDLAWYFEQSEQIKTAFNTSIQMDKQGRVIGAGGLYLQLMPSSGGKKVDSEVLDNELINQVENAFRAAPSLGTWYSEKGNNDDIIYGLFREFSPSVAVTRSVVYDCPCSEETFRRHILNLPKEELDDIRANGPDPLEITCHNCGSTYFIPVSSLKK